VYVAQYLPLDRVDPLVAPPYFLVARGGRPAGTWLARHPGLRRPGNWLRYAGPLAWRAVPWLHGPARRAARTLRGLRGRRAEAP
jgi:hypothetical protein